MDNPAYGVASIHLANLEKYIKVGNLHDWAQKEYPGASSTSTSKVYFTRMIKMS